MICLSLEKFLISIPFHKVGKNIKDFLLWFASPKTFPKIPKTIPWPWPQLVAIYTPLGRGAFAFSICAHQFHSQNPDLIK